MGGQTSASARQESDPGTRWTRILGIEIRQPYYNLRSDGVCEDLVIAPTAQTRERLAGHGFLWRGRGDGGDILAPASIAAEFETLAKAARDDEGGSARCVGLAKLLTGPPLMFTARILRAQFASVTEIPAGFENGGRVLCLSNRSNSLIEGRPDGPGLAGALAPQWDQAIGPAAPMGTWATAAEAAGFVDEAARLAGRTLDGRLPFALLELHLIAPRDAAGGDTAAIYPFDLESGGRVTPIRYRLAFEPRRTRWRYVVGMRSEALDAASLAIGASEGEPIRFDEDVPSVGELPGAVATRCFTSGTPIPLAQRPRRSFYLEGRRQGGRRAAAKLIDPLPAPPADALVHRGTGGDDAAAVSEIYVFV